MNKTDEFEAKIISNINKQNYFSFRVNEAILKTPKKVLTDSDVVLEKYWPNQNRLFLVSIQCARKSPKNVTWNPIAGKPFGFSLLRAYYDGSKSSVEILRDDKSELQIFESGIVDQSGNLEFENPKNDFIKSIQVAAHNLFRFVRTHKYRRSPIATAVCAVVTEQDIKTVCFSVPAKNEVFGSMLFKQKNIGVVKPDSTCTVFLLNEKTLLNFLALLAKLDQQLSKQPLKSGV